MEAGLYLRSNIYKATPSGKVEPEFFAVGFHGSFSQKTFLCRDFTRLSGIQNSRPITVDGFSVEFCECCTLTGMDKEN